MSTTVAIGWASILDDTESIVAEAVVEAKAITEFAGQPLDRAALPSSAGAQPRVVINRFCIRGAVERRSTGFHRLARIVRLQSYDWPGNVRELQNVIERSVILARGGVLEFDLPVRDTPSATQPQVRHTDEHEPEFLTEVELRQRERENLLTVLERAHWKIKGPDGAAELLGVKPSTLLARIRAMKLKRPR